MNRNMNAKWTKIKMISSCALFISAFLALIAGINAQNSNPTWTPLYPGTPSSDGASTNLDPHLFRGGSTTVYDPIVLAGGTEIGSNRIILFGGFLANAAMRLRPLRLNDVLDIDQRQWPGTNALSLQPEKYCALLVQSDSEYGWRPRFSADPLQPFGGVRCHEQSHDYLWRVLGGLSPNSE